MLMQVLDPDELTLPQVSLARFRDIETGQEIQVEPEEIREAYAREVQALIEDARVPGQGSIFIGTKGNLLLAHIAKPVLLPDDRFKDFPMPKLEPVNHWHSFVEAVRGNGQTSAHFGYAGPLTETVLLGGIASRFPKTTLEWDAAKVKFKNVAGANQFVRRPYRKGWEVKGLS